jgi:hypothetical protein
MIGVARLDQQPKNPSSHGKISVMLGSKQNRVAHGKPKTLCTAPGSLDNGLHYAAAFRLSAIQRSLAAMGLTRPFFSTSHSVL